MSRGHIRAFLTGKPHLAALRDADLDPSIPAHHAELVKRGLAGDPALEKAARKFRPREFRFEERGVR
jgi:hypothetical protein